LSKNALAVLALFQAGALGPVLVPQGKAL